MANDIRRYPHTHDTDKDAVVIDLRDDASAELVRSLHDIVEQLGSIAVERITIDPGVRKQLETLLGEATHLINSIPPVNHTNDSNSKAM